MANGDVGGSNLLTSQEVDGREAKLELQSYLVSRVFLFVCLFCLFVCLFSSGGVPSSLFSEFRN